MILRVSVSILLFVMIAIGIFVYSEVSLFFILDIPSLILVFGGTLAGTLWSHPLAQINRAFRFVFSKEILDEQQGSDGYAVFSRMGNIAMAFGVVGTIIGFVMLLHHMDDPTKIGPAMPVVLLPLLYGVLLGEFLCHSFASECASRNKNTPLL